MNIEILDWPETFFVEAVSPDHWMRKYGSPEGPAPHLVDISIPECDCEKFTRLKVVCEHIKAAQKYRDQFTERPKTLPPIK